MNFKAFGQKISTKINKIGLLGLLVFGMVATYLSVYLYSHSPFTGKFAIPCITRELFKVYCPGCGATRATYELLHGDLWLAFRYNPLLIVGIPFIIFLLLLLIGISINDKPILSESLLSPTLVRVVLVVIISFWILRNIPLFPFTLLAPDLV